MVENNLPEEYRNEIINENWLNICYEKEDGLLVIPPEWFDLCVTDYPYALDYQSNARKKKQKKIHGDDVFNKGMINSSSREIYKRLKDDSHAYFFTRWDVLGDIMTSTHSKFDIKTALVIPSRGKSGMGDLKYSFAPAYEIAVFCQKGKREFSDTQIVEKKTGRGYVKRLANWIDFVTVNVAKESWRVHPNQKSLAVYELFILLSTERGDWVLDPFAGSAICAIACEDLGRNYLCIERDEHYYEKAVKYRERYRNGELDDMVNDAHGKVGLEKKQVTLSGF